jgi:hypothetical protein
MAAPNLPLADEEPYRRRADAALRSLTFEYVHALASEIDAVRLGHEKVRDSVTKRQMLKLFNQLCRDTKAFWTVTESRGQNSVEQNQSLEL